MSPEKMTRAELHAAYVQLVEEIGQLRASNVDLQKKNADDRWFLDRANSDLKSLRESNAEKTERIQKLEQRLRQCEEGLDYGQIVRRDFARAYAVLQSHHVALPDFEGIAGIKHETGKTF